MKFKTEERLGFGPNGASDVKSHTWFSRVDWKAITDKTVKAPFIPIISSREDTQHFDRVPFIVKKLGIH
jgi:hypothetical protein